jgi:nucleotide-binding universal stress UspA family protein
MYSTIVVGTDGSATAAKAVREASELARAHGATLHLVHAFHPVSAFATIGPDAGAAAAAAGAAEAAEAHANVVLGQAGERARHDGLPVETHLCCGDPAKALLETAEAVGADLLVVGNKGMSGVRRFVLSSVPSKVSHHSPCSLLIVNTT